MPRSPSPSELRAFDGPGETAELARTTDWRATGFGAVEDWPASLRIAGGICLTSHGSAPTGTGGWDVSSSASAATSASRPTIATS